MFFEKILAKINKFWYRTFTPSNVLKIRNVDRDWVDRDHRFYHAAFTILIDFVDQEMGGEAGLERYIQNLSQDTQIDGVRDTEIQQYIRMREEHTTMLQLYRWYNSIDWQNPVPESPEYLEILSKTKISTEPTEHGTYKMVTTSENPEKLNMLRAIHMQREQEFEKIKMKKLLQLCTIHQTLWN
jgi:hypothetical protein